MGRLVRTTRLWVVVGIVAVVFGVLPILGSAARIAVIVAGVLLLLAAVSQKLSGRIGDGDPSDREHRYYDPLVGRPPRRR